MGLPTAYLLLPASYLLPPTAYCLLTQRRAEKTHAAATSRKPGSEKLAWLGLGVGLGVGVGVGVGLRVRVGLHAHLLWL